MKSTFLWTLLVLLIAGLALFTWDEYAFITAPPVGTNPAVVEVVGAVKTPGSYPFQNGMTVEDAVRSAGGVNTFAIAGDYRILALPTPLEPARVWLWDRVNQADEWLIATGFDIELTRRWPIWLHPRYGSRHVSNTTPLRGGDNLFIPEKTASY